VTLEENEPMNRDDRWIQRNFKQLMDLYGGRCVAVVNQKVVAVGKTPYDVERLARRITKIKSPSVLRVPQCDQASLVTSTFRLFGLS
jgi:hypothetical protein